MVLYNASTGLGLRNITRFLTNTDTSTYSNIDLDASLNMYQAFFANEILDAMDGWDFQGEVATTDMVALQQEYVFPNDILKIKRIELSYDGTNWYRAEQFDVNQRSKATDTASISRDFDTFNPYVDMFDNSLLLYPIPQSNSTGGIKIWYEKELTNMSDASDEPKFCRAYHKGLAYGAAKDYFEKYLEIGSNSAKATQMGANMQDYIARMKAYYRMKTPDFKYNMTQLYTNYDYGNKY